MLLTDNAVPDAHADRYGFLRHAQVLCRAIEATTELPLTVGVLGPWGTGKTSFLNICRDLLVTEGGTRAISFNPWKYDRKDEIWHALIQSVLEEIEKDLAENRDAARRDLIRRALEKARRLSRAAAWLAARRLAAPLTAGVLTSSDVADVQQAWEAPQDAGPYWHINRFEADFAGVRPKPRSPCSTH
jgi:ATPase subunit of ABC transporter with duplicated ATPase domains